MKRKQPEELARSLESLRKALGEDPGEFGLQVVPNTFDAFLLSNSSITKRNYVPKILDSDLGYFRPDGWWQFRVDPWCLIDGAGISGERAKIDFDEITAWPVAYHGTSCHKLKPILTSGLRKPGETPLVKAVHGQVGAGPDGSVYLTPSLWYASHPAYSPLMKIGEERWAQAVLKLRARPGSYRIQDGTLGNKHWTMGLKIDPNFSGYGGLEWLFDCSALQRCDYVIVGIMLREVGAQADVETFGRCPALTSKDQGPEYRWTAFLCKRLEEGGFSVDSVPDTCDTESETCTSSIDDSTDIGNPDTYSPLTCDCTEDDCSLDHGDGLRDAKGIITRATAMRSASKLEVQGALTVEYRLSLGIAAALTSREWSKDTMKRGEREMADLVIACLVRGQGTRMPAGASENYNQVLKAIKRHACKSSEPLAKAEVLEWHRLCLKDVHAEAGTLRTSNVKCGNYPRLHGHKVHYAIDEYVESANLVVKRNDLSGSAKAAWCFYHLCRIHPFRDGNGRISRLVAIWALARHGLPWMFCLVPLFTKSGTTSRTYYIQAIEQAAKGEGRTGADTRPLAAHICRCLLTALSACKAFEAFPPGFRCNSDDFDMCSYLSDPLMHDDTEDTTEDTL